MASGSASASNTANASQSVGRKPAGSRDPTWKHGIMGPVPGTVICTWCMKKHSGGINRLKYHLAGIPCRDAKPCKKCPEEVQREMIALLAALDEKKLERARQQAAIQEAIAPTLSRSTITEMDVQHIVGSTRGPRIRGESSSTTSIKFNFVPRNEPGSQPSLEATGWNKEVHKEAEKACANFWYYNNIPFNVARSPYWESLVTALTIAGKGFKAPSPRDLSGRLLQDAILDAKEIVQIEKKQWQKYGCSILSDGWTDGRNRTLINFIVVSNEVMVFLKSIDASNIIKNAENLSLMLEEVVLEVGIENVVQVVTDNAAAYVAARRLLQERHPTLFWTPCAAHCLDLLLEDIGKIDWVKPIVDEARDITKYMYNHPWVLQLMREHTKGKELVRSGATRFATNFLTLQSITSLLTPLKQMFVSQQWVDSTYSKKADGEKIVKIIFDGEFASRALEIVKLTEPLVRVLRLVDGEKNVMGYLYEAMDRAKEAIQHYYRGDANRFAPIWDIIDRRWNNQLHQPIHAVGYFLNPKFYFSESGSFTDDNGEVMEGLITCIERMTPISATRDLILLELQNYKAARGQLFSSKMCVRGRGIQTPSELAHMKHEVSNGKTQDVSISEMKEQEMQPDEQITSDCSKGPSIIFSSGADSQKDNPQSWTLEPQTEKLTQSSAISVDSSSINLDFEGSGGVAHHQEANSTIEQGISDKPEVYTESKDSSSINVDSGSCREKEPQNFNNINSNKMLAPEKDNTLIVNGLVKQDTLKETEVHFKAIEIISDEENDLQASSKVVTAVQDMNFADGCLIESSKEAKKQEVESSACVVSSTIDHEKNCFDRDYSNEDSTEQKSRFSDMDTFKHEVESSSCIGSSIINHDKEGLDPDCKKEDFTEKKSTISDMDILRHDDANEIAQEKLNKTPASELVVDEKSVPPEFHLSEYVDCSHEGNTVEQGIPVKVEDHVESADIPPLICGDTDKSRDVEMPASFHCKLSDGMLHLEEDKEKVIEDALFKQEPVEETLSKAVETTSCEKHDTQDSSKVIPDPGIICTDNPPTGNSNAGEKEEVDCCASSSSIIECGINDCSPDCRRHDSIEGNITLSERDMHDDSKVIPVETLPKININEAINENSAASDSQQLEAMVYTDEKKSTKEQAISVKPGDYIECKNISPSSGVFEIHNDGSCLNSNVGNIEDILQPEAYKSMTTGSNLSMHALLDESKVPYSKGIERDIDQKLDLQTSSEHIIPDQRMSLTSSSLIEDSNSKQMQSAECSGYTKVSLIECDLRDGDPGCEIENSIQGNTVLPDVDIDSNIMPQQKYSEAPASDPDQESAALESVQQKTRDPNLNLQGDDCTDLKAEIQREESDCEGNEKGPELSSIKEIEQLQADTVFVDKSCSTTKASSHLNGSRDNLEDSFRESINDVHGDKSLKNCEPALWEQLLETNVNNSANQETYQSPENAGTSPGNPFIYENKLSSKEEVPQTLAIDGIRGLILEQRESMSSEAESMRSTTNNRAEQDPIINSGNEGSGDMKAIHSKDKISEKSLMVPADLFEAPSFMTLVESGNHSEQQLSHNEIQPKVKESNGELSADAEMSSGTHERFHIPLRSLLAEENIRGTHEHSKPDPLLVFQPQTSSQNKIQAVQASSVKVSDQTVTSSQNETLPLKDINSSSKLAEKVWNSPARLPSMKVEKQKASKVKSVWTMCLCGCDTK